MTTFFILGLGWLVPLHFMPWVSWHSEVVAFVAAFVLVVGLVADRVRGGLQSYFQVPRSALLFVAAGVLVVIQAASGLIEFWGDAAVIGLYLALCIAGLTCGYVQATRARLQRDAKEQPAAGHPVTPLAWALVTCSVISSVIALVQVFDVWDTVSTIVRMPELRRPGANLAQPNHLGTLLLMGMASLLFLFERRKLGALLAITVCGVLALGIAATESRTALLGIVLLCVWALAGRAKGMISTSPAIICAAGVSMLAIYIAWPIFMAGAGSFEPGAAVNARIGWRLVVWPQLLETIAMRPLQGWGLHEVAKAHNAVASAYKAAEPYTYAHNIVLELAIGCGIPLTLLTIGAVLSWAWRRIPFIKTNVHWYCIAAALPFFVHSMLEFPYAYAYFLLPVMFLAGVFEAETIGTPLPPLASRLVALAAVPLVLLAMLSVYDYLRVEEDFRVARFEALRIGRKPADYSRPRIAVLTQLDALLDAARLEPRVGMLDGELQLARQAALRFPWPATQNRYALALALNGRLDEATRQLQVIRTLHGDATYRQVEDNWRGLARQHPEWAKLLKH